MIGDHGKRIAKKMINDIIIVNSNDIFVYRCNFFSLFYLLVDIAVSTDYSGLHEFRDPVIYINAADAATLERNIVV